MNLEPQNKYFGVIGILRRTRELLFFDGPLVGSGGRFLPKFFTHACFFGFRVFCTTLFFFHLARSMPEASYVLFISCAITFVLTHLAILLPQRIWIFPDGVVLGIELTQTLLDLGFGTIVAVAYPPCQILAITFFFLPVTQASLLGPSKAWSAVAFFSIFLGTVLVFRTPNVTSVFSLFVLATATFVMRVYRGTQIKLITELNQARAWYESLVEHIPQMITRKNPQGVVTYANQAFCALNGLPKNEVIGSTDEKLYGEEMAKKYLADDKKVIETKQILPINEKHRPVGQSKDMDVEGSKIPVFDAAGEVTEVQIIFWDVTDRRRKETQLEALMETTQDHIYFKDSKSAFLRINRTLATRFGLREPTEAIGKNDFEFFNNPHAQQAFDDEQEIMRTDISKTIEEEETWPDGSKSWVSTTKQCLKDKDGSLLGTFGISRDITHRKHNEEALKQARDELIVSRDELKEVNSRLDKYLSRASKIAHFGFWEWDIHAEENVKATDEVYEIFGVSARKNEVKLSSLRSLVHPDDRHIWDQNFSLAALAKPLAPFEIRLQFQDGTIKYLYGKSEVEQTDEYGLPSTIVGLVQEVTDRKNDEMRAKGLELAVCGFQHMIPGKADDAGASLEIGDSDGSCRTGRAKALYFIFMIRQKADEVRSLFYDKPWFQNYTLKQVWEYSWVIACDLILTRGDDLKIVYGTDAAPETHVSGALYTAAVNILSNARLHGTPPFFVWTFVEEERLVAIFADGGPKRAEEKQRGHGIGLPLVTKILGIVQGRVQPLNRDEFCICYPTPPEEMKDCQTFFRVMIPL